MKQHRIPSDFIQTLLSHVDIVEYISNSINLKKKGKNYFSKCCFHKENSDSFCVSPERQTYHCFGCGAHGNVINWHMEYYSTDFVTAITSIARHAGLSMPSPDEQSSKSDNIELMKNDASKLFQNVVSLSKKHMVPEHAINIQRINNKWMNYKNVEAIQWIGEHQDIAEIATGINNVADVFKFCGMSPTKLRTKTPMLVFFESEKKDRIKGFVFPDGTIWSQNPSIPLVAIHKDSHNNKRIDLFCDVNECFITSDKQNHLAIIEKRFFKDVRSTSLSMLKRFASKITVHKGSVEDADLIAFLGNYRDGDGIEIVLGNEKTIGALEYLKNYLLNFHFKNQKTEETKDLSTIEIAEHLVKSVKFGEDHNRYASEILIGEISKAILKAHQATAERATSRNQMRSGGAF